MDGGMTEPDDPTIRIMRNMGWHYDAATDWFERDGLMVARNQAQAAIAAAVLGKEYVPTPRSREVEETEH